MTVVESAESKAERYERRFPGTGVSPSQAAERQERLDAQERAAAGRRARFVSVPELPWKRGES